jgi:hypothetical protein
MVRKKFLKISCVTLKIGPVTSKLDDNWEIKYSNNIAIFNIRWRGKPITSKIEVKEIEYSDKIAIFDIRWCERPVTLKLRVYVTRNVDITGL